MTFTADQPAKLERYAIAMLDIVDVLIAAGVPDQDPAVTHLAEGHIALMKLLYPNGEPAAPGEMCACGQPAHNRRPR